MLPKKKIEDLINEAPFQHVQLIHGAYTKVDSPSIVGFCHNKSHKGVITVSIMNQHDCIAKGCHYFEKYIASPYWERRQRQLDAKRSESLSRKRKKENHKLHLEKVKSREDKYVLQAKQFAEQFGFDNLKIISAHKTDEGFTVFYISESPTNDWYAFREVAFAMSRAFQKKITLKHIKTPEGSYAIF